MNAVHFLIPGDPDSRTGGYSYDRRIMAGLAAGARAARQGLPDWPAASVRFAGVLEAVLAA